jgi:hypothetical protein
MPIGKWRNFADCVKKNTGKVDDPEAYCAVVQRKVEGKDLKESADWYFEQEPVDFIIREAVVMLDKAPCEASVIVAPNGDTLVIPKWTGQFDNLADEYKKPEPYVPDGDWQAQFHVEDAARILGQLTRMKRDEKGEGDDAEMLQDAISALTAFIRSESEEVGARESEAEPVSLSEAGEAIGEWVDVAIEEAGRRNSTRDEATLRKIVDLVKELGIDLDGDKTEPGPDHDGAAPSAVAEADSVTGEPEAITFRESGESAEFVLLSESLPAFDDKTQTIWITPIQPGWGNRRDNNYYPTKTLKEATEAGKFNHLKMYKDHPTKTEERDLPERSVTKWFATTREAVWDETRERPRLPILVHDPLDYRRMKDVPEQIAFSVLGGGMARPGQAEGRNGRIVESISDMRSVDWVTTAGAGGGIELRESASSDEESTVTKEIEELTPERLAEANPALYEHLVGLGKALAGGDKQEAAEARAAAAAAKTEGAAKTETKESDSEIPAWFAPFVQPLQAFSAREAAGAAQVTLQEAQKAAKATVEATLAESTAIKPIKDAVAARYADAGQGEGQTFADADALKAAVEADLKLAEAAAAPYRGKGGAVAGLGASAEGEAQPTPFREAEKILEAKWGDEVMPKKERYAFTSDELMGGVAPAPVAAKEQASPIAEASKPVEEGIAARLGV